MRLLLSLILLGIIAGCNQAEPSTNHAEIAIDRSSTPESPFTFDETNARVLLDTRIPPKQRRRFDIAQGSITIETVAAINGLLTIHYTPEVEGGYSVYECNLPISDEPVVFEIDSSGLPGKTSFNLNDCKTIKTGNLHFDE